MPHSVKVLPNASHGVTFKQYKKEYPNTAKAILKSIWKNKENILAIPKFHRIKPVVAPPSSNRKRVGHELEIVSDEEFLRNKDLLHGGRNYWEDHSNPTIHREGFDRTVQDGPDHYTTYRYLRISHRPNAIVPWAVTVYREAIDAGSTWQPSTPTPVSAPAEGPRPLSPPRARADQRPSWTEAPSAQQYGTVPAVTFTPRPVSGAPPTRAAGAGNSAPFSYAPFRGFVKSGGKARRSSRTPSRLRYSDLYPYERECVRTKLGGWAAFSKLPYSQQIAALRRCRRPRS